MSMWPTVPKFLAKACRGSPEGEAWLEQLPSAIRDLEQRWSLSLMAPFDGKEISCAWVAPATLADGTPAILKLGMPHFEGEDELEGLQYWDGNPTVNVLRADIDQNAMLLERCLPGTNLRSESESEQDRILAGLLRRLWQTPTSPHPFRPLSAMLARWSKEARQASKKWPDAGLVSEGLRLFEELPRTATKAVLLATDLHAGNVLRAEREPWLVIDPKPFVGDPAYDATQHLLNCASRLHADPDRTIRSFADLLRVDHERVRLWTFARVAAAPWDGWESDEWVTLARAIAP